MRTGIIGLLLVAGLAGCGHQPEPPELIYHTSSVDAPALAEADVAGPIWSGISCTLVARNPQEARQEAHAWARRASASAAALPDPCAMLRWFGNRVLDWTGQ